MKSKVIRYNFIKKRKITMSLQIKTNKRKKNHSWRQYWMVFIVWSVYYFVYFGLQYSLFSVDMDALWLGFSLFGVTELLGLYLASSVAKKHRRVITLRVFLIIAALACLLSIFTTNLPSFNLILFLSKIISC